MQQLQGTHDQEGQQLLGPLVTWVQKVQQLWSQQTAPPDQAETLKGLENARNELGDGLNQLQAGPGVPQQEQNDVTYWHDQAQCAVAQWTTGHTGMLACTHMRQQHSDTKKKAGHLQDQLSVLPQAVAQLQIASGEVHPAKQPSINLDVQQAPCVSEQARNQPAMSAGMAPTQGEPEVALNHGQQRTASEQFTARQEEVASQPQAEVPTTAAGTQGNFALDAEVEDKLQATRRVVASLQSTKVLAEHALAITRQQLAEANQKLFASNLKLEEADEKLAEYEQKLAVLDKTVQQLREDHKEGTQTLAESCDVQNRMQKKISKQVAKVEDLYQETQGLTGCAKKLTAEVENLKRQIITMGANHVTQRQEEHQRWEAILAERESELAARNREAEVAAYKHGVKLAACKRENEALRQDKAVLQLQVQQQDAMHKGRFFGFNDWVCQQGDHGAPAHQGQKKQAPYPTHQDTIPAAQQAPNAQHTDEVNMYDMIEGDYGAPAPKPAAAQMLRAPYFKHTDNTPAPQQAPNIHQPTQDHSGVSTFDWSTAPRQRAPITLARKA